MRSDARAAAKQIADLARKGHGGQRRLLRAAERLDTRLANDLASEIIER
jgi:hypothetical protein